MNYFPLYKSLCHWWNTSNITLQYYYGWYSDELASLVSPVHTFISKTHHSIYTVTNHLNTINIPLRRRRFHSNCFLPRTATTILTTSRLGSSVIFLIYPHNLNFLTVHFTFITKTTFSNPLYLEWLLDLLLGGKLFLFKILYSVVKINKTHSPSPHTNVAIIIFCYHFPLWTCHGVSAAKQEICSIWLLLTARKKWHCTIFLSLFPDICTKLIFFCTFVMAKAMQLWCILKLQTIVWPLLSFNHV